MSKNLTDFKVLSFDCYGTLIDWETGIYAGYEPLIAKSSAMLTCDQILKMHGRYQADQEAKTPKLLYPEILFTVFLKVAHELGVKTTREEAVKFGKSVVNWPVFPDTSEALQYLKKYYKLVILSNVDRESFKGSNKKMNVEFDYIFTAQDIGSYKPNQKNFDYLIEKLSDVGIQKNEVLHTAESLFHDHVPANRAGLMSAWIYRRHAKKECDATHLEIRMPHYDFQFASMSDMVRAHQEELSRKF